MPVNYSFPNWIQPADPAAHYQAGFALGERLGATQAAQAFQQQQLARELQKDEFERQSQMALMQLKVDEAARQHRANAAYQTMIARGIDPMEALKSVGPEMGVDPSRVMAMQEQRAERQSQQAQTSQYQQGLLKERELDRVERASEAKARLLQAQAELEARNKPSALQEKITMSDTLEKQVQAAAASGDKQALGNAIRERDRKEAMIYPKGTRLEGVDPSTGKSEIRIAGGTTAEEDALTASTKSKLQQELQGSVQAAKILHDMDRYLNSSNIGPLATAGEKLGRYGLLGPAGVVSGRAGAPGRAAIRGAKLDLVRELETKGHASATILKEVEKTLPSLGFFETPSAARAAVNERKLSLITQGLNQARDLRTKAPDDLIQLLSVYPTTRINELKTRGIIPPDAADAAVRIQFARHAVPVADWVKTNTPSLR